MMEFVGPEQGQPMSEEELKLNVLSNMAWGILPSVIKTHPNMTVKGLIDMSWKISEVMMDEKLSRLDKLNNNTGN